MSEWIGLGHDPSLARAGAVGLWAQTNYQMMTSLFRVEERSVAYAIASVTNVLITIAAMVVFVAVFHWGAVGLIVGNFVGTLCVYAALVVYRRDQLHFEFDRALFRAMQSFGMPLVPSALALWAINFIDREFVSYYKGNGEVGIYSTAIKIGSVVTFVVLAFRTAWPAFAYSIEDDRSARRAYAYVLTYVLLIACWISLALSALAPWLVRWLTNARYLRAEKGVALLAFAFAVYAGYTVLAIGSGRARRTQMNWVVTGIGAAVNVGLNFWLIPRYGMVGAAIATAAAYVVLFVGMAVYAQSVYPVAYQWRRNLTAITVAIALDRRLRATRAGRPLALPRSRSGSCSPTRSALPPARVLPPGRARPLAQAGNGRPQPWLDAARARAPCSAPPERRVRAECLTERGLAVDGVDDRPQGRGDDARVQADTPDGSRRRRRAST